MANLEAVTASNDAKIKRGKKRSFETHKFDYAKLKRHQGHNIECVMYGDDVNMSVECVDCHEIIIDYDNPKALETVLCQIHEHCDGSCGEWHN